MFNVLLNSAIVQYKLFLDFDWSGAVFRLEPWEWRPVVFRCCASRRCLQGHFIKELVRYISVFVYP